MNQKIFVTLDIRDREKRKTMRKLLLLTGAAAISLSLAACSGKSSQVQGPEPSEEIEISTDAGEETDTETQGDEEEDMTEALFRSSASVVQMEITTGLTTEYLDGLLNYPVRVNFEEPVELKGLKDLDALGLDKLYTDELLEAVGSCDVDSLAIEDGKMTVGDPDGANVVLSEDENGNIGICEFNYGL